MGGVKWLLELNFKKLKTTTQGTIADGKEGPWGKGVPTSPLRSDTISSSKGWSQYSETGAI